VQVREWLSVRVGVTVYSAVGETVRHALTLTLPLSLTLSLTLTLSHTSITV